MQDHFHRFDDIVSERSMSILGNEAFESGGIIPYTVNLRERYHNDQLSKQLITGATRIFPTVLDDYDNNIYAYTNEALRFYDGGILFVRLFYAHLNAQDRNSIVEAGEAFKRENTVSNPNSIEQQGNVSDKYQAASWAGWSMAEPTIGDSIRQLEGDLCEQIVEKTAYHNGIGFMIYLASRAKKNISNQRPDPRQEIQTTLDKIYSGEANWDTALNELL